VALFDYPELESLDTRECPIRGHEGRVLPDREGGEIDSGYVVARRVRDQGYVLEDTEGPWIYALMDGRRVRFQRVDEEPCL
jgi:hypothetical protein